MVTGRLMFFPYTIVYRAMLRGNQHKGRKYGDLQNWLDMTSHEKLLLGASCPYKWYTNIQKYTTKSNEETSLSPSPGTKGLAMQ